MNFQNELQRLEARLEIPYPERRELLDELSAHLDALYEEALAEGLGDPTARQRAIDTLAADDEFFADMSDVHKTALVRALESLPRPVRVGLEALFISGIGLAMVATVLTEEAKMIDFLRDGGIFMILINIAGVAMLLLTIERVWSLFIKRDHSDSNIRRRIDSIRFLGRASVVMGLLGTLVGFYQAFAAGVSRGIELPMYEVTMIAISTSIAGLTYALLAMLATFVIETRARRIEALRLT